MPGRPEAVRPPHLNNGGPPRRGLAPVPPLWAAARPFRRMAHYTCTSTARTRADVVKFGTCGSRCCQSRRRRRSARRLRCAPVRPVLVSQILEVGETHTKQQGRQMSRHTNHRTHTRHSQGLPRIPSSPRTPTPASIPLAQAPTPTRRNTEESKASNLPVRRRNKSPTMSGSKPQRAHPDQRDEMSTLT